MRAGRQAGALVRAARADAVAAHSPGPEPAARHRFRLLALTLGTAALAGWVGYGVLVGRAIGSSLRHPGDGPYFAGLLSGLGSWWADLGLGGQVLVIAAGVALIIALGGSLALALGASGCSLTSPVTGEACLRWPRIRGGRSGTTSRRRPWAGS